MPSSPAKSLLSRLIRRVGALQRFLRFQDLADKLALWPIAVFIGVATGYAVLGFRYMIHFIERLLSDR